MRVKQWLPDLQDASNGQRQTAQSGSSLGKNEAGGNGEIARRQGQNELWDLHEVPQPSLEMVQA